MFKSKPIKYIDIAEANIVPANTQNKRMRDSLILIMMKKPTTEEINAIKKSGIKLC